MNLCPRDTRAEVLSQILCIWIHQIIQHLNNRFTCSIVTAHRQILKHNIQSSKHFLQTSQMLSHMRDAKEYCSLVGRSASLLGRWEVPVAFVPSHFSVLGLMTLGNSKHVRVSLSHQCACILITLNITYANIVAWLGSP